MLDFYKKYKIKKGFTLTELLVAMGVVGVLVAILISVIHTRTPDDDIIKAKHGYSQASKAILEVSNDSACYPNNANSYGIDNRVGLDDGFGYDSCLWGRDIQESTISVEGDVVEKFATLFMYKLGYFKHGDVETLSASVPYTTNDGISWTFFKDKTTNLIDTIVFDEQQCKTNAMDTIDEINFPTSACPSSCTTTTSPTTTTSVDSSCFNDCKKPYSESYTYVDSTCFSSCKSPVTTCKYTSSSPEFQQCVNTCYTPCCDTYKKRGESCEPCSKTCNDSCKACSTSTKSDSECNTQCRRTGTRSATKSDTTCNDQCQKTETTPGTTTTDQTCCENAKISELNSKRASAKDDAILCCGAEGKAEKLSCCNAFSNSSVKDACISAVEGAYSTIQVKEETDNNFITILVDVNGVEKGNNCTTKTCTVGKTPDTFSLYVKFNGELTINPEDTWVIDAIKASSGIHKK